MNDITPPNPELEKPEYTRLSYPDLEAIDDAEARFQQGMRLEDAMLQHSENQASGYDLIAAAAKQGHPLAQWWIDTRDNGERPGSLERLTECANRKHPIAQTFLGHYFARENDHASHREALELYQSAAEGGHIEACYLAGLMYAEGIGADLDFERAERWLKIAANAEHPWAQIYLSMSYTKAKREKDAAEWLIRAKAHNNSKVNIAIDRHYFQLSTVLAQRCAKGDEKSFETLRELASGDHGNRYALRRLYYCLNNGLGTNRNVDAAYACIRRLNEREDVLGQLVLAHMYFRGMCGLKRQMREALTLYNKAFRNPEIGTVFVPKLYHREYDAAKKHYNLDCTVCRLARARCSKCVEFAPRKKLPKRTEEEKKRIAEEKERLAEEKRREEKEARRAEKKARRAEKKRSKHEKKHNKRQRIEE